MAQTITDRNGNTVTLNGTNDNSVFQSGSYVDTLGRNVVSWTGIGSGTGDQLSVSGLGGNIVVKWITTTISFPVVSHFISSSFGTAGCTYAGYPNSFQIQAVSEIDLPDGTKYSFTYGGQYGALSRITFPGGGYARYTWADNPLSEATYQQFYVQSYNTTVQCYASYDTPAISDRYVSYNGTTEVLHQHFGYSTGWPGNSPNWNSKSTTVTNTDLVTGQVTATVYNYGSVVEDRFTCCTLNGIVNQVPVEKSVLYQDGSGNTLRTVNKTWLNRYAMIGQQTILDNGQGSTILRCYDATNLNRVLAEYEYDFQSQGAKPADPSCASLPYGSPSGSTLSYGLNTSAIGPLKRQTNTAYHTFSGTNILDEPDSVTVYDGSGNEDKQTTYAYDGSAIVSSGTNIGLVSPPGLRGNATTASRWLNTSNSFLNTTYTYYDTGQMQSMTDPCGNVTCSDMAGSNHTTTYLYTDAYSSGTPPGATNAYLTKITDALGHSTTFTYAYSDGQVTASTDPNSQVTRYKYNTPPAGCSFTDGLDRLSEIDYPDTGKTTYCYNDAVYNSSTPSPSIKTSTALTSGSNEVSTVAFDGLGHTVETLLSSDPDGTTYTTTSYDGLGRIYQVFNPYRSTGDPTYGMVTYAYDPLGRVKTVTEQDGSKITTTYSGNCTTVTDAAGKSRKSCVDGLGRMTGVWEDPAVLNYETDYVYDALNDLTSVNQTGSNSANARTRTFHYDSLSRLTSAVNPESGTILYGYDANGNLNTKTAPAPNQTGSATVVTSHHYDVLNRLVSHKLF